MQRVQYKIGDHWLDSFHLEAIDWRDYPEVEDKPEEIAFSIVGKGNESLNRFELAGFSHEASVELQASFDAMNTVWSTFADAFADFVLGLLAPCLESFSDFQEWWDGVIDEKHFDGVYSKPKMKEYFKMQPNVCNLNDKIRKARNLL